MPPTRATSKRSARYVIEDSTVPADNATLVVLDTTKLGTSPLEAASTTPGSQRGNFPEHKVEGSIRNGDQAVTVELKILTGSAGTSADWETVSGGSYPLPAGATLPIDWSPSTPDCAVWVVAGANNPNSLVTRLKLVPR